MCCQERASSRIGSGVASLRRCTMKMTIACLRASLTRSCLRSSRCRRRIRAARVKGRSVAGLGLIVQTWWADQAAKSLWREAWWIRWVTRRLASSSLQCSLSVCLTSSWESMRSSLASLCRCLSEQMLIEMASWTRMSSGQWWWTLVSTRMALALISRLVALKSSCKISILTPTRRSLSASVCSSSLQRQ